MTLEIMLVAGEPSGDALGAALMCSLRQKRRDVVFRGVGGPLMFAEGLKSIIPFNDLAVMGLGEILPRVPRLLKHLSHLERELKIKPPDALVTIDSPDFNFRLVSRLTRVALPKIHYVAPTVWAWRPKRARKIVPLFDHLLTLFPFEPPYFEREGLRATFVGHPLFFELETGNGAAFRDRHQIDEKEILLLILPGSRNSELSRLLPIFRKTIKIIQTENRNLHARIHL